MGDSIKRVIITGDATGLEQAIESVVTKSSSLYERLSREAQNYTSDVKQQQTYIERLLDIEKKRSEIEMKRSLVQIEKDKANVIDRWMPIHAKKDVLAGYEEDVNAVKNAHQARLQEILETKQKAKMEKMNASQYTDYEDVSDGKGFGSRVSGGIKRGGSAIASGLGIGVGLGIFGILYEMVNQGTILEKSLKGLDATMSGLDKTSLGAATSLGKTTAEMAEISRQFAVNTGGMYGRQTVSKAKFGLEFERAFGIAEGSVNQQAGAFRMTGGKDLTGELYTLVKDLNQSGYIKIKSGQNDFTKMAEALSYYGKLNDMQSRQMGIISPGVSSKIISTLFATGVPGFNDQRIMGKMEGLNSAITNPGNDFTQAFTMRALAGLTGGNFLDTKIQQERGIFGKGNLKAIFESLMTTMGGGSLVTSGKDMHGIGNLSNSGERVALGLQSFTKGAFNYEDSKRLISYLGNLKPEEREDFFNKFGNVDDNEESKKHIDKELKKAGISGGLPTMARRNVSFKEKLVAEFNELMGKSGDKALEPLRKLIGGNGSGISQSAESMGLVASATMNLAVGNFATAVRQFAFVIGTKYNDAPKSGTDATSDSENYHYKNGNKVIKGHSKLAIEETIKLLNEEIKKLQDTGYSGDPTKYNYNYDLEQKMRIKKQKEDELKTAGKDQSSLDLNKLIQKLDEVATGINDGNKQRAEGNKFLMKNGFFSGYQQPNYVG